MNAAGRGPGVDVLITESRRNAPRGKTAREALCVEKRSGIVNRRIAVAPMMDWTDDASAAFKINSLRRSGRDRSLYVASSGCTLRLENERLLARRLVGSPSTRVAC
jgi:hypothetical protein